MAEQDERKRFEHWLDYESDLSHDANGGAWKAWQARAALSANEIHNLNWALGTTGYEQMATPEEQAEHEAGAALIEAGLARMAKAKAEYDAMAKDAARYRWLRVRTQGARGVDNYPWFKLPAVPVPNGMDIMRGSVAQHLDSAIDLSGNPG